MSSENVIGIVGLGNMGGGMARNLVDAGWSVYAYDIDDDALASLAEYGATAVESPAALADAVPVVLTSLPTPDAVIAVYLGEDGLNAGASGELIALELSTIDPATTDRLVAEATNLTLLDSPVSGGPEKAREGTLTLMVGGDRDVFERDRVQSALSAVGENIYHLGEVGAGHTTKLLNNQIGACVRAAVLEAAAIAAVKGVSWEPFMQVVRHSSGSSYQFRKKMPRVLNRDFEPGFDMKTSQKDIRLALSMANEIDAPAPMTSEVYELYKRAIGAGLEAEDTGSIVKLFEETTGVPVQSDRSFDPDFLDWKSI